MNITYLISKQFFFEQVLVVFILLRGYNETITLVQFPLQPYRTETSRISLFRKHSDSDRTNEKDTIEYATFRSDAAQLENDHYKSFNKVYNEPFQNQGKVLSCVKHDVFKNQNHANYAKLCTSLKITTCEVK